MASCTWSAPSPWSRAGYAGWTWCWRRTSSGGSVQGRGQPNREAGPVVDDVDVVAQLAGQPQPHATAGEVGAVGRAVAGEGVVHARAAVADPADHPVTGRPQPQLHRRSTVPDRVRAHLVDGQAQVLDQVR